VISGGDRHEAPDPDSLIFFSSLEPDRRPDHCQKNDRGCAMSNTMSAAEIREWAEQCDAETRNPKLDESEREHLLRMKGALLTLAENKDWIETNRQGDRWASQGIRSASFHF
jgi:hypothetical protein